MSTTASTILVVLENGYSILYTISGNALNEVIEKIYSTTGLIFGYGHSVYLSIPQGTSERTFLENSTGILDGSNLLIEGSWSIDFIEKYAFQINATKEP